MLVSNDFFARDPSLVAKELLGKVIRVKYGSCWLAAKIIETEAYYLNDKASHASLGYTEKRKALFMSPGTIYMYYSRGGDSLNLSCLGDGNAVLIKSGYPYIEGLGKSDCEDMIRTMRKLHYKSGKNIGQLNRPIAKLCSGQVLLCKSLDLKVKKWDQKILDKNKFYVDDVGYRPTKIIQTTRLGIAPHRDAHLPYRFIDWLNAEFCTNNPLRKRLWSEGKEYFIIYN